MMVTGDNPATAEAVAKQLGLDEVRAGVLPEQKGEIVKRLQAEGRIVAMAGDGINDAPALAQAQVGIAMGTGTDVAMESAGVTLVKGDLRAIARARGLSRRTMSNIKHNLFFAFVYNAAGVPVAAGVLYPFFGLLLSMGFALRANRGEASLSPQSGKARLAPPTLGASATRPPWISRTHHPGEPLSSECAKSTLNRAISVPAALQVERSFESFEGIFDPC